MYTPLAVACTRRNASVDERSQKQPRTQEPTKESGPGSENSRKLKGEKKPKQKESVLK